MDASLDTLLFRLKMYSPMPEDDAITEETIDAYEEIVAELRKLKDPRIIQPLINSFGYGLGYGVYQGVVGLLEQFSTDQVDPLLIEAIQKGDRGSRMWAATMLKRSRNRSAVPFLLKLLNDPEELVRNEAVAALGILADASVRSDIERLRNDPSNMVKRTVELVLSHLKSNKE